MKTTKKQNTPDPAVTECNALDTAAELAATQATWGKRAAAEKKLASARAGGDARTEKRKAIAKKLAETAEAATSALEAGKLDAFRELTSEHAALKAALAEADSDTASAALQKGQAALAEVERERAAMKAELLGRAVDQKISALEEKGLALAAEVAQVIRLRQLARARGAKLNEGSDEQRAGAALLTNDPLRWLSQRDRCRAAPTVAIKEDPISALARRFNTTHAPVTVDPEEQAARSELASVFKGLQAEAE